VFGNWAVAYCRQLKGSRHDTPILAAKGSLLVGGAYLCDKTTYDNDPLCGEVHYTYVQPEFTGMGIYSALFREAVDRSISWGLSKLYITTDRYLLPDMYLRWGATEWKTIPKWRLLKSTPIKMIQKVTREFRYYWFRLLSQCD
jgi:GNAT superfamily N-acetyltransferase